MRQAKYSKILWGIGAMVLIFTALLVLPKTIKTFINGRPADAQSSNVILAAFDPNTGPPGVSVTLYGNGFTSSNTVHFSTTTINNINSADGTTLTFTVPNTLPDGVTPLPAGDYAVYVSNSDGQSNAYAFTVTCSADNSNCSNSGGTYTGPVYLCSGASDCIQGFKVPIGGVADSQTITLDGHYVATTTSYSFDGLSPGLHTVSITVPANWYSGYTLCINSINCHSDIPIQGDSVSINFLSTNVRPYLDQNGLINVPAGSYIDLYWHFSQNFTDFVAAPGGLNGPGTGTSTPTSTPPRSNAGQVASYTGGNISTTQDPASVVGISQATNNALGCNIGQILTPAIRGVIAGDQSLLAAPKPIRSAGGGASIIANTVGDTGPLNVTQLPAINGQTLQIANDQRYARAAQVGFPNQPSWDAVSYCLQNSMIKYIQQSAIKWMYTSFNGNPAFVQNLSQFLLGIQNQAVKNYFSYIQSHNSGAPFQAQVSQNLITNYNSFGGGLQPYDAAADKPDLDGLFVQSQNDDYNMYGAELKLSDQLQAAIDQQKQAEIYKYQANNGTLNVDDCSGASQPDNLGQPTNCKTNITGYLANTQFAADTSLATQRFANNSGGYMDSVTPLANQSIYTVIGTELSGGGSI